MIVIAIREIVRGLGFDSTIVPFQIAGSNLHAAPQLSNIQSDFKGSKYFKPISAFDSLLYLESVSVANVSSVVTGFSPQTPTAARQRMEASSQLYQMMNSGYLIARVPSGQLPVYSYNIYSDSPQRVKVKIYRKAKERIEFLMNTEFGRPDYSLLSEMKHQNMSRVFGEQTLQVLKAIGYRTNSSEQSPIFEIAED